MIDRPACAALKHAVWMEHSLGTECICYYGSLDLQGAKQAVFFFHGGDRLTGTTPANSAYLDNTVRAQIRSANVQAKRASAYRSSWWRGRAPPQDKTILTSD